MSIVTPSYNQGRFLEETIRSVLLQGYPNLEYMVIDGGSQDDSFEIISNYEPWLTYWISEPDQGQSHAINKGWARATGELVAWLNSDDLYLPQTLGHAAQAWRQQNEPGFIHAQAQYIDAASAPTGKIFGAPFDLRESLATAENGIAQLTAFINHATLKKAGHLDQTLHMAMDWDLWLRLAACSPHVFVDQTWGLFRAWPESKTQSAWAGRPEEARQAKLFSLNVWSQCAQMPVSDEVEVVKKFFQQHNSPGFNRKFKRRALAAAYGAEALKYYHRRDYHCFRRAFLLSLLVDPTQRGGPARTRLPLFLFSRRLLRGWENLKRRLPGII